jgi:regulator of replication initiation timing
VRAEIKAASSLSGGGAAGFLPFYTWLVAGFRFRGNEPPPRASQRAPLHLKTTACSEANGAHHRPAADRSSPKVGDRHSPRSPLPEVISLGFFHLPNFSFRCRGSQFRRWRVANGSLQKKRAAGTRVAELEAKLGKVQDELKKLREQLASAEAAKKDAQVALEEAKKRVGTKGSPASSSTTTTSPPSPPSPGVESAKKPEELKLPQPAAEEESSVNAPATDVFEVVRAESGDKENHSATATGAEDCEVVSCGEEAALAEKEEEEETKKMIEEDNSAAAETDGAEKESWEVLELKAKLAEKDAEIAALAAENAELKKRSGEAAEAAKMVEEDAAAKAAQAERDLKDGAAREARTGEQLRASEAAREALDAELRRLRVQTEQWRKAAEAAAAVLGGDNHLTGLAGSGNGNGNGWGDPATMPDDGDDEGFGGKRKGAGIRVLSDLWRKKGSK